MTRDEIFDFLEKVTDAIKAASPLVTMMGIPFVEKLAGFADTAVAVGRNALDRADDGSVVLSSTDVEEINARIAELDSINAGLAAQIEAS